MHEFDYVCHESLHVEYDILLELELELGHIGFSSQRARFYP
jgi:hypothetical protein